MHVPRGSHQFLPFLGSHLSKGFRELLAKIDALRIFVAIHGEALDLVGQLPVFHDLQILLDDVWASKLRVGRNPGELGKIFLGLPYPILPGLVIEDPIGGILFQRCEQGDGLGGDRLLGRIGGSAEWPLVAIEKIQGRGLTLHCGCPRLCLGEFQDGVTEILQTGSQGSRNLHLKILDFFRSVGGQGSEVERVDPSVLRVFSQQGKAMDFSPGGPSGDEMENLRPVFDLGEVVFGVVFPGLLGIRK